MNWHIWKCSGIVCSCSTETGIRERENEMSGIVIEKVRKSFDTKDGVVEALKDVNLNIDSGDIYGIIGMSGAGKSTLVRCMNFLEVPTEGQVLIDGKALGDLTEKELRKQREEIGMIFQHFNLLMQKSVIDNVCFPLYIKGKKKAEPERGQQSFWRLLVWGTGRMLILHSSPVVRSRGLPLQEHLHQIRDFTL